MGGYDITTYIRYISNLTNRNVQDGHDRERKVPSEPNTNIGRKFIAYSSNILFLYKNENLKKKTGKEDKKKKNCLNNLFTKNIHSPITARCIKDVS